MALAADQKDLRWTASTGPVYTSDRLGKGGAALDFAGGACATTIPVVRSDATFTAAAWVKLTDKAVNRTVLAIGGTNAPAWVLAYHAANAGGNRDHQCRRGVGDLDHRPRHNLTHAQRVASKVAASVDPGRQGASPVRGWQDRG